MPLHKAAQPQAKKNMLHVDDLVQSDSVSIVG